MALNAIDGMLARDFGQCSAPGAYLNELADPVSDTALYLPFPFLPEGNVPLTMLVIFLANLSEMAGVQMCIRDSSQRWDSSCSMLTVCFWAIIRHLLFWCRGHYPIARAHQMSPFRDGVPHKPMHMPSQNPSTSP